MSVTALKFKEHKAEKNRVCLDLGTGKGMGRPEGFIGVDKHPYKGVKEVVDLTKRWPWKDESVDEVMCGYLLEYFTAEERIRFMNELYRVLKHDAKAVIVVPYWCAAKAYGDPLVAWPPVTEAWFAVLGKEFRDAQNHKIEGYTCDFKHPSITYGLHPIVNPWNAERQQHAISFFKEAAQDLCATLNKE